MKRQMVVWRFLLTKNKLKRGIFMKCYLIHNEKTTTHKLCSDEIYYEALYDLVDSNFDKEQILCLLFDAPNTGIEQIINEMFENTDVLGRTIENKLKSKEV